MQDGETPEPEAKKYGSTSTTSALLAPWEESLLAEVFQISLNPTIAKVKQVLHLSDLEEEMKEEQPEQPWSLGGEQSRNILDRVLLARLNSHAASKTKEAPLIYMMRSYGRALHESRGPVPKHRGQSMGKERDLACRNARDVLASYAILTITEPDMWADDDQVEGGRSSSSTPVEQLCNLLKQGGGGGLPPGFLDDLIRRTDPATAGDAGAGVSLEDLFQPVLLSLIQQAWGIAESDEPMRRAEDLVGVVQALVALTEKKPLAALFVRLPKWIPEPCTGRSIEEESPLGCLFSLQPKAASFVTTGEGLDLVAAGMEWGGEKKPTRQESVALGRCMTSFRESLKMVRQGLYGLLRNLLQAKQAKEHVLNWLGQLVNQNRARAKDGYQEGFQDAPVSSDGLLCNALVVLLLLCEPFLSPTDDKALKLAEKVDLDYFLSSKRVDVSKDTQVAADPDTPADASQEGEGNDRWLDPRNLSRIRQFEARRATGVAGGAPSPQQGEGGSAAAAAAAADGGVAAATAEEEASDPAKKTYGTIAEYAGLTSRLVHLGLVQSKGLFSAAQRKLDNLHHRREQLKEALEGRGGRPLTARQKAHVEEELRKTDGFMREAVFTKLNVQTLVMDPVVVVPALRLLRLQGTRLIQYAAVGQGVARDAEGYCTPPLPMPPPPRFASLPAHLLEDIPGVMRFAEYTCPPGRSGQTILRELTRNEADDLLTFLVTFIGSQGYMRNPYLRANMVEAVLACVPEETSRSRAGDDPFHRLFEDHSLARRFLGTQLLEFFVDIEFTGSHTQFYDKFNYRSCTARVLEYLWDLPAYRNCIVEYSKDESRFVKFANMLVNDSIYHMDDALKKLAELKSAQRVLADASASEEDKARAEAEAGECGKYAKYSLREANQLLGMMRYMSQAIVDSFMGEGMRGRIAQMLNYFLDHLVGKKSRELKVSNMAELEWRPREVLHLLVNVYVNFATCPTFANAVAEDQRSYCREHFEKALSVVSRVPTDGTQALEARVLASFRTFADQVDQCAQDLAQEDDDFSDPPDHFLDPISCEMMKDPVTLPTSNHVMDRATILRHLLSDQMDPYSRKHLTEDMLVDNTDLKAEIEAWKRDRRRERALAKASRDAAGAGADAAIAPAATPTESLQAVGPSHAVTASSALPPPPPPSQLQSLPPPPPPGSEEVTVEGGAGGGTEAGEALLAGNGGGGGADDDDDSDQLLQQALALSLRQGQHSGAGAGDLPAAGQEVAAGAQVAEGMEVVETANRSADGGPGAAEKA